LGELGQEPTLKVESRREPHSDGLTRKYLARMKVINTPAYYSTEITMAVKGFMLMALVAEVFFIIFPTLSLTLSKIS
jgi:hypothetical protein